MIQNCTYAHAHTHKPRSHTPEGHTQKVTNTDTHTITLPTNALSKTHTYNHTPTHLSPHVKRKRKRKRTIKKIIMKQITYVEQRK